jgi:hypothetical protein
VSTLVVYRLTVYSNTHHPTQQQASASTTRTEETFAMSSHLTAQEAEPGSGVKFDHPAEANHAITVDDRDAGTVTCSPKRTKVAIMGFATSSRDLAPFDDPEYEIWTLNQLYRHVPRATRHFDIHCNWDEDNVDGTDHRGWIRDSPIPVYMMESHDEFPNAVRYPIERVIGDAGIDYFTSTVAFEVGLAMVEGFKEISLYGIDVRIPGESALLKQSYRYGYEREPSWGPLQMTEVSRRIEYLSTERNKKMALINALDGALAEDERWYVRKMNDLTPEERMKALTEQRGEAMATLATIDGAIQETTYWRDLYTLRGRGAAVNSMI